MILQNHVVFFDLTKTLIECVRFSNDCVMKLFNLIALSRYSFGLFDFVMILLDIVVIVQ